MAESPETGTSDETDCRRIFQLSDALAHRNEDFPESGIKKELRVFVRRCLDHLPDYIDKTDARNSNFSGTYVDNHHRNRVFQYHAFTAYIADLIHGWFICNVDELPHPSMPNTVFSVIDSACK